MTSAGKVSYEAKRDRNSCTGGYHKRKPYGTVEFGGLTEGARGAVIENYRQC